MVTIAIPSAIIANFRKEQKLKLQCDEEQMIVSALTNFLFYFGFLPTFFFYILES